MAEEAEKFRHALAGARSQVFLRLFDYLLARSADPRPPKEVEIAVAVFDKEAGYDPAQDSTVRVHVHRLRKRIEAFYQGRGGARLTIPSGEYRIVLAPGSVADQSPRSPLASWWQGPAQWGRSHWRALVLCAALLLLPWAVAGIVPAWTRSAGLAETAFWQPIAGLQAAPLIVAGDYFSYAETNNEKDVLRLVMQPPIRSRKDLDRYLVHHPESFYRLYDMDIHSVPVAAASSLWALLGRIQQLPGHEAISPALAVSSQLSEGQLRTRDVIYVGRIDALGPLSDPLFYASGFATAPSAEALVDRASGTVFAAQPANAQPTDENGNRLHGTDYGYIASFVSPFGHRIMVIAGLGDAALARMTDLVSDKRQLDALSRRLGTAAGFEALYRVQTMGNLPVDTALLIARPLGTPPGGERRAPVARAMDRAVTRR